LNNYGTANQVADVRADLMSDIERLVAVADSTPLGPSPSGNNHFTNPTTFFAAANKATLTNGALEGIIVVDIHRFDPSLGNFSPYGLPRGINVRGALVLNFDSTWSPLDKLINTAMLNINPADLNGLNPDDPLTYRSGYPPTYGDPSKDPSNVDITLKGFANFSSLDAIPAMINTTGFFDIHGSANICGPVCAPNFLEIENQVNGQTQYIKGPLIAGEGIFLQNPRVATSLFSRDAQRLVASSSGNVSRIASCDSHNVALRPDGRVADWPGDAINVINASAVAAGGSHGMALVGEGPPKLDLALTNAGWTSGVFSVALLTESGRAYRLEYKTSLSDNTWTALPLVGGKGTLTTFGDATDGSGRRFYRVSRW
jgi:hypothetical protein